MKRSGWLVCWMSLVAVWPVHAEPDFRVNGLHVDLTFDEAVGLIESLGGACEQGEYRQRDIVRANCTFPVCADAPDESCDAAPASKVLLEYGSLPIVRVAIEAPGAGSTLDSVAIGFDGNPERVQQSLVEKYGAPDGDTSTHNETSWTHASRLGWKSGRYHLGLLKGLGIVVMRAAPTPGVPQE